MPATYSYTDRRTTIRCSHCNTSRTLAAAYEGRRDYQLDGTEHDTEGRSLHEWLRWLPQRDRYHAWCRDCERRARRATAAGNRGTRRAAGGRRGPNTERKFGVELELIFPSGTSRSSIEQALHAAGLINWRVKSDISIHGRGQGWEVVSPPLQGEAGFDALQAATRVLRGMGAEANRTTGTHVHHDASDLRISDIKQAARSWYNNQRLIDGLVSPSRRGGPGCSTYCQPMDAALISHIERARDLRALRTLGRNLRRVTFNLAAYARHGTIEIRQHQGTCDFEKIKSWVLFGQALIDTARGTTLNAESNLRQLLDNLGDNLDATAKTYCLGRALEFGHAPLA